MNIENHIGEDIKDLFAAPKYQHLEVVSRGFALPQEVKEGAILFVGLNPSYVKGNASDNEGSHYYPLLEKGNYKYYRRFEQLSEMLNIPWAHFDMLAIRETKQKKVQSLIKDSAGCDMIWQNLLLSKRILESAKPRVIVVQNSLARTFLGKDIDKKGSNEWLGLEFEFDQDLGTDRIISDNEGLNGVPVFFTSMLTGQRALDNGSYERLEWHLRKALGLRNDTPAAAGGR